MKLCIFPGTFNPIHIAHLKMADYVVKHFGFDKILFIPAYNPPHKDCQMSTYRLKMVELAIKNNPHFEVSDIEYKREGKSYTYLTVLELYKKFDIEGKISFIIGRDAYEKFDTWFEAEKLKKLVNFIVFEREDSDISSSDIRQRIKDGISIKDLVDDKVGDYIERYGLYK